ncbi:hypothetical protein GQ473_02540 [archaeon]|nr:hypothetical protein [archaeon]
MENKNIFIDNWTPETNGAISDICAQTAQTISWQLNVIIGLLFVTSITVIIFRILKRNGAITQEKYNQEIDGLLFAYIVISLTLAGWVFFYGM